jgi:hypothetical protein
MIKGYHYEISGNGYDLLIREDDDKIIARFEGDFYDTIEDMTTPNFRDTEADREALIEFGIYVGFIDECEEVENEE